MAIVDVRNVPTIVEVGPSSIVADFTEEQVVAQVMVGPTVVEFSWGELVPEPGLRGGGPFEGTVTIGPWIPGLPETTEAVDPVLDRIMVWDESMQMHVQRPAALGGGGGGGGVEFATREETDEGVLTTKAIHPDGGAYAYDRLRHVGQHAAGKGTASVVLTPVSGVITIDCALSNVFEVTLAENVQFANPLNPVLGQTVNVLIRQNLTGGYKGTFGTAWTFTNRILPNFSSNPGAVDLLSCQWDATANKMRATFLPNFGTGLTSGAVGAELTFTNVGGGNEVVKEQVDTDVRFRTLIGTGDINVTTEGDNIVINYDAPPTSTPTFETLPDVTIPETIVANEFLKWNGEQVVQAAVEIPDTVNQTYLTQVDETATLPNSRRVIAGSNISLDYTTEGQLVISSIGMEGEWLDNDGCAVSRTTDLATSASAFTSIVFTVQDRDDNNYWDPAAPDRFTIPTAGWYAISCHCYWNSTNTAKGLFMYLNGLAQANEIASDFATASSTTSRNSVATIQYLQAGDYIAFRAWSTAAAALSGAATPARAAIHRLGVGPPGPRGDIGPPGPAEDDGTFVRRLVDDTVLGNLTFEHIAPRTIFTETDRPVNEKRWDIYVADSKYALRALGDTDGVGTLPGDYLVNHRAEAMTGWTTLTGNPGVVVNRCPPVLAGTGTNGFWGGTSASSSMTQRVSFSSFPEIDLVLLDAGVLDITMDWWGGSWVQGNYDKPRIILRYLNAALTQIGTSDTGVRNVANGGTFGSYYWEHYTDTYTIPALTRHIDVELIFTRTAGTNNDATITDIVLSFNAGTVGADTVYEVTRESYRALNLDIKTDTLTHNGNPVSELGHTHDQFAKTYGAVWRTSNGSALSASDCQVVYVSVPAACSINEVILLTEGGTGSCVVDVWKDTFANFPPTVADAITGLTKPTILIDSKARDEELNGWTREIAAGDVLAFKVVSTSVFSTIQIQLRVL